MEEVNSFNNHNYSFEEANIIDPLFKPKENPKMTNINKNKSTTSPFGKAKRIEPLFKN